MYPILITILMLFSSIYAQADNLTGFKPYPSVKIGSQEYFTGYQPKQKPLNAQYRSFSPNKGAMAFEPIPKEFSMKESVQRIFRQLCGDCWAQGAITAFENIISWFDKASTFLSRQAQIDCSNFGSCGGGQLSMEALVTKGATNESDYPYKGSNGKCKAYPVRYKALDSFYVKNLTWPELQRALLETGALEVCGASSALKSGGWVSSNPSGRVDHCYALVGWYDGLTHGKPAGSYGIIANSWGSGWGDNGFGYYLLAKDGINLDGDVITEAQGVIYKPACFPQPVANAGPEHHILVEE